MCKMLEVTNLGIIVTNVLQSCLSCDVSLFPQYTFKILYQQSANRNDCVEQIYERSQLSKLAIVIAQHSLGTT